MSFLNWKDIFVSGKSFRPEYSGSESVRIVQMLKQVQHDNRTFETAVFSMGEVLFYDPLFIFIRSLYRTAKV